MQQHLGRQDGVAKVDVNLKGGRVVIYPKADSVLDPVSILKATYDSGVTVAEMTITASGRLLNDPQQGLLFKIAANQDFPVKLNALARGLRVLAGTGAQVTLRGRLYSKPPGKQKAKPQGPFSLEILEVIEKEATRD